MANKDFRFMETVFKICISMFKYKPAINIEQFFSDGFAEQKSIMTSEIIDNVKRLLKTKISKKAKPAPVVPPRYGK